MRRLTVVLVTLLVTVALALLSSSPAPAQVALPQRMAAVGDSITAATDVAWCCVNPNGSNPQYSWSTGTDPAVASHYQRLVAANGGISIPAINAAVPGAD